MKRRHHKWLGFAAGVLCGLVIGLDAGLGLLR